MNLFRKGNSFPQRKPFSMTEQQILEDIMAVTSDEEQRNKLYYCLDEKPPQEHKFIKLGDFLKGTQDLESLSEKLADVTYELSSLRREVKENNDALKANLARILQENNR